MRKIIKLFCQCFGCNGTRKTATDMRTGRMVPQTRCAKCNGRGQIPETADKETAYIGCPLCNEMTAEGLVPLILPAGSPCPLCEDGYCEVGMTQGQLDRIMNERDAMLSFVAEVADCVTAAGSEDLQKRAANYAKDRRAEVSEFRRKVAHNKPTSPGEKPEPTESRPV